MDNTFYTFSCSLLFPPYLQVSLQVTKNQTQTVLSNKQDVLTYNWKFRVRTWLKVHLTLWLHSHQRSGFPFCSAFYAVIAEAGFPPWLQYDLLTSLGLHTHMSTSRQGEKLFLKVLSEEPESFNFSMFSPGDFQRAHLSFNGRVLVYQLVNILSITLDHPSFINKKTEVLKQYDVSPRPER